jgi:hypothetical protein
MITSGTKNYWWESKGQQRAQEISGIVGQIDTDQSYKRDANLKHLRLYGSIPILGLNSTNYAMISNAGLPGERYTFNVIRSNIDTLTNKIAKNKIKITYLTDAGQQSAQRKSKQLAKFVGGVMTRTKARQELVSGFRDCLVSGNGWVKVFKHQGKVHVERTFFDWIKWDDRDAESGKPSSLFEVRIVKRDVAKRLFPKFAAQIEVTPSAFAGSKSYNQSVSDAIYLYEAWHLPTSDKSGDGVHSLCTQNDELFTEEWKKNRFPFVHMKFSDRLIGFGGTSLTEMLVPGQVELNKTMHKIQQALHLSAPKLIVEAGSQTVKSKFNNEVGGIIETGTGGKFQYVAPQPIDQMYYQHKQAIINELYEQAGVSQLAAQSKKPEGLDSGKALREFNDIESERFMLLGQMWEEAHVDLAELIILEQKDLQENGVEGMEKANSGKFIETIKWSEVDMERDAFVIQAYPTSYLSQTPTGRLSDVKDLMGMGMIDQTWAAKLLDFPDLEGFYKYRNADITFIEYLIERIVDFGDYIAPDPKIKLDLAIPMFYAAYLNGRMENLEQERLDLLQRWMVTAQAVMKQQQNIMMQEQMQQQAAMAGQQPAAPMPPEAV